MTAEEEEDTCTFSAPGSHVLVSACKKGRGQCPKYRCPNGRTEAQQIPPCLGSSLKANYPPSLDGITKVTKPRTCTAFRRLGESFLLIKAGLDVLKMGSHLSLAIGQMEIASTFHPSSGAGESFSSSVTQLARCMLNSSLFSTFLQSVWNGSSPRARYWLLRSAQPEQNLHSWETMLIKCP